MINNVNFTGREAMLSKGIKKESKEALKYVSESSILPKFEIKTKTSATNNTANIGAEYARAHGINTDIVKVATTKPTNDEIQHIDFFA